MSHISRLRTPLIAIACAMVSSIAWAGGSPPASQDRFAQATIVSIHATRPGMRHDRHVEIGNPRSPGRGVYFTSHVAPAGALIRLASKALGSKPITHFDTTLPLENLPKVGDQVCIKLNPGPQGAPRITSIRLPVKSSCEHLGG